MTESARIETVGSIEDLLALVSLNEIRYYEIGARAKKPGDGLEEPPTFSFGYSERTEVSELEDRFRFVAETDVADYLVEVSAIYALNGRWKVPQAIRVDFAERVGFMAVFPYIRETLTTAAARLGKRGPLLDLMRPGDLKIDWNPDGSNSWQDASNEE